MVSEHSALGSFLVSFFFFFFPYCYCSFNSLEAELAYTVPDTCPGSRDAEHMLSHSIDVAGNTIKKMSTHKLPQKLASLISVQTAQIIPPVELD